MSQMPENILLHKDCKYNTSGHFSAFDENAILSDNDYNEEALKDYVEYIPVYRIKELLNNACHWLRDRVNIPQEVETDENGEPLANSYIDYCKKRTEVADEIVKEFREQMIRESLAAVDWNKNMNYEDFKKQKRGKVRFELNGYNQFDEQSKVMSRAKEQALKAYPDYIGFDDVSKTLEHVRNAYVKGYKQAEQDLLEQAKIMDEVDKRKETIQDEKELNPDAFTKEVSADNQALENAANAYIGHAPDIDESSSVYGERQAFKAGAKWQKEYWDKVMRDNHVEMM